MKLGSAYRLGRNPAPGRRLDRPTVPGYEPVDRRPALDFDGVEAWDARGPAGLPATLWVVPPTANAATAVPRHPNVLSVLGVWKRGVAQVVATERPGASLNDRLDEARSQGSPGLSRAEVVETFDQIARAVDFLTAHDRARSVRLNPHAIWLLGGCWKLGPVVGPEGEDDSCQESSTRAAQPALARLYCRLRVGSPTAVDGAGNGGRLDLAALPTRERGVVARAIADDPSDRWPSCQAFAEAIRGSARLATTTAVGTVRPGVDAPSPGQWLGYVLSAAAGAAAVAGVVAATGRPFTGPRLATVEPAVTSRVRLQSPSEPSTKPDPVVPPPGLLSSTVAPPPPAVRIDAERKPAERPEPEFGIIPEGSPSACLDGPDATFDPDSDPSPELLIGPDPSLLASDVLDDSRVAPPPPASRSRGGASIDAGLDDGQAPPPPPLRTTEAPATGDRVGDRR